MDGAGVTSKGLPLKYGLGSKVQEKKNILRLAITTSRNHTNPWWSTESRFSHTLAKLALHYLLRWRNGMQISSVTTHGIWVQWLLVIALSPGLGCALRDSSSEKHVEKFEGAGRQEATREPTWTKNMKGICRFDEQLGMIRMKSNAGECSKRSCHVFDNISAMKLVPHWHKSAPLWLHRSPRPISLLCGILSFTCQ